MYGGERMGAHAVELENASLQRGGSRPWQFFLAAIFPIPLVFLVLLSIPLPAAHRRSVRLGILNVLDKLSYMKLELAGASVTVLALIILVALVGLGFSLSDVNNARRLESETLFVAERKELRCKRWRAERNMWISLLGLILWLVLGRIRGLLKDVGPLEDQLRLAEEARDKAEAELAQKTQVTQRLQDAVEGHSRQLKEKDEALLKLRAKADEAEKLQARIAKLEVENEGLKRDTKKTS